MRRFIMTVLGMAVFFIGLGVLVDKAGAHFKSDEKALALVAKARQAIGGDSAISSVQSLRIVGKTTRSVKIKGLEKAMTGDTEIALQFPDNVMKMTSMGNEKSEGVRTLDRQMDLTIIGEEPGQMRVNVKGEGREDGQRATTNARIVIKKDDGTIQEMTGADAEKWIAEHQKNGDGIIKIIVKKPDGTTETINGGKGNIGDSANGEVRAYKVDDANVMLNHIGPGVHGKGQMRHNDMLRLSLSLLLTAPQGIDVEYTYAGEGDVDGAGCDIVNASFGGQAYKLFLDKSSSLPVAMSFKGEAMPQVVMFTAKAPDVSESKEPVMMHEGMSAATDSGKDQTDTFTAKVRDGADGGKGNYLFKRIDEGLAGSVETMIKFSDYRAVNGVQLPYTWTQTGGDASDIFNVSSYEVNPVNIAEKFQNQKVMVRTKKSDNQ